MFPLFPLGQIVATPGAVAALERAKRPSRYSFPPLIQPPARSGRCSLER
jgi:hypothetical protein